MHVFVFCVRSVFHWADLKLFETSNRWKRSKHRNRITISFRNTQSGKTKIVCANLSLSFFLLFCFGFIQLLAKNLNIFWFSYNVSKLLGDFSLLLNTRRSILFLAFAHSLIRIECTHPLTLARTMHTHAQNVIEREILYDVVSSQR